MRDDFLIQWLLKYFLINKLYASAHNPSQYINAYRRIRLFRLLG